MSALPLPPDDLSIYRLAHEQWAPILREALHGRNTSPSIDRLGRFLAEHKDIINSGRLNPEFDWRRDLERAELLHESNCSWATHNRGLQSAWISYWNDQGKTATDFTLKITQDGLKYILALHGTSAIAALNALTNGKADQYKAALMTCMFGAVAGIVLLAAGQIILISTLAKLHGTLKSKLLHKTGWRTIASIGKYIERYFSPKIKAADWLIYGSIVWFCLYIATTLLLIAHA